MKNLTKIFMMVAALFAFACTTDVTEDLGVQLGDGAGQTTITLSLEESRTQLGEKAGDLYPLYWSEGDAIAANGVASNSIADEWVGKSGATFTFAENLSHPYHIVYPAPAEGVKAVTEGCYPVVFPAVQKYVAGNIDGAAAVMYGYAEEGTVPTLNHLTGILRFAVKGDVTLASMVVTAEKGALSGTYDVNCATGALTVQEGSTGNSVSVSFGDGLKLSAEEASLIHVAVPAGEYGAVRAVLTTTDGKKMTLKFDSNAKPIAAATVRDFKPFTFVENALDGDIFEIYDVEDLLMFAKTAASFPWSEAKLMNDIDMTGVEWSAAEGFAKVFNGNNKTIKGLSAPLFGTTCAQIKDLTLTDVALTSNGKLIMGSIACLLTSGGQEVKASLTNCKAVGTFTVSNPEWQPTSNQSKNVDVVNYGGLVGRALGADITNCTNQVAVTVEQMTIENNTVILYPSVAGVVGYVNKTALVDGTEVVTTITSTINDAAVSYNCIANASNKAMINRPYVGGVIARCEDDSNAVLTDSQNTANGAITLNSSTYGTTEYNGGVMVGGFASRIVDATITNCDNYGKVTVDNRHYALLVGGVAGLAHTCTSTNCDNFGEIEVKETALLRGVLAGGAFGCTYANAGVTSNCTNNAKVTIAASTEEGLSAITSAIYYRIGGVIGFAQSPVDNLTNNKGGDLIVSGDVTCTTEKAEDYFSIAGVVAFKTKGATNDNMKNYANVTVNANFKYVSDAAAAVQSLHIGGVLGGCSGNPRGTGIVNEGTVTFDGSIEGNGAYLAVAGVVGGSHSYYKITPLQPLLNKGEVIIGENAVIKVPCSVGGLFARNEDARASYERFDLKNEGAVTVKGTIEADTHIGGLGGFFNIKCTDGSNSGTITLHENASVTGNLYIGGIAGYSVQTLPITGLKNSGAVKIDGDVTGNVYIGGVYGTTTAVITGASNTGAVTYGENASISGDGNALYIGGILGASTSTEEIADLSNGGAVSVNGPVPGDIYLGGVLGHSSAIATSATNAGAVTVGNAKATEEQPLTIGGALNVGGVYGTFAGTADTSGMQNSGAISVHKNVVATGNIIVSGIFGGEYVAGNLSSITNSGNVEVYCNTSATQRLWVSGVAKLNVLSKTATDITNTGNVTVAGISEASGTNPVSVAGVFSGLLKGSTGILTRVVNGELKDGKPVDNKGKITVSGTTGRLHQAGLCAFDAYNFRPGAMDDCHNYGAIVMSGTSTDNIYVCGLSMSCHGGVTSTNTTNEGAVTVSGTSNKAAHVFGMFYNSDQGSAAFVNCHNNGNITITESATMKSSVYIGGFGYRLTSGTYEACSNSGNITHNGNQTAGSAYLGGLGGGDRFGSAIEGGFINSGNISFGGTLSANTKVYMGGIAAHIYSSTKLAFGGEVKNTGKVSFTGNITNTSASLYAGGLFGDAPASITALTLNGTENKFVNTGAIEVTGSVATAANAYVGGVIGYTLSPIAGATVDCDIKAMGYNAGMIMGVARTDAIKATNCKVGGSLVYTIGKIMVDPGSVDEGIPPTYKDGDLPGELNSSNWFECIYSAAVEKAVAEDDGCSLLTEKPTVPTPTVQ